MIHQILTSMRTLDQSALPGAVLLGVLILCNSGLEAIGVGLVFGLMHHPEAIYARWLHPNHTHEATPVHGEALDGWEGEGLQLFRNAVEHVLNQE